MSSIDEFLQDYRGGGTTEDSEGVFTIDFQTAREKLAKFQLSDPHQFILKVVQAGNLEAESIQIELALKASVSLVGWNDELALDQIAERLLSPGKMTNPDAVTHLCIGLNALLGKVNSFSLKHKAADSTAATVLKVGAELEWDTEECDPEETPGLMLSWNMGEELSSKQLRNLLTERCVVAPVPIFVNGSKLIAKLPESSGAHREKFFEYNRELYRYVYRPEEHASSDLQRPRVKFRESERAAELKMTVDLDPTATIWFCQAGILADCRRLDLGVPGLYGFVQADEVATDLTGLQLQEGEAYEEVQKWLRNQTRSLLGDAIGATRQLVADGQPARANAPVRASHTTLGCLFSMLGCYLTGSLINVIGFAYEWHTVNVLAWCGSSMIWVWLAMKKFGAAKDSHSDAHARNHILDVLQAAQRGLRH